MTLFSVFRDDYILGMWWLDDADLEDWFGPDFVFGRSDALVAMPNSFWTSLMTHFMTTRIVNDRASHAIYKVNKIDGAYLDCSRLRGSDIPRSIQLRKKYAVGRLKCRLACTKEEKNHEEV